MSTLDDWIMQASLALDLPADTVTADLRNDLLDLTRDVAHGVARIGGPLTCYLVGIAVGRGQAPSSALAAISALLPPDGAAGSGAAVEHPGAAREATT